MKGYLAITVLLACAGAVSCLFGFGEDKAAKAAKTLFGSGFSKNAWVVDAQLKNLQEVAKEAKNNQYDNLVKKYLEMQNVNEDKCNLDGLRSITRPVEDPVREENLTEYRDYWTGKQFQLCHEQFEEGLKATVDSLTSENKLEVENVYEIVKYYFTSFSLYRFATEQKLDPEYIGIVSTKYLKLRNQDTFEADLKSESAASLGEEGVRILEETAERVQENTKGAFEIYYEIAPFEEATQWLNDYELEWLAKLRLHNDIVAILSDESNKKKAIEEAASWLKYGRDAPEKFNV